MQIIDHQRESLIIKANHRSSLSVFVFHPLVTPFPDLSCIHLLRLKLSLRKFTLFLLRSKDHKLSHKAGNLLIVLCSIWLDIRTANSGCWRRSSPGRCTSPSEPYVLILDLLPALLLASWNISNYSFIQGMNMTLIIFQI